ncbi:MAG TPA: type 2 lanthipeptide synthetase LanM family protein, partial [Ktedonobacteraceae bacterium]|nr:type 2 lanthipeptide synthetase LanM family protein [Ktedonobacteraceae bacterium]
MKEVLSQTEVTPRAHWYLATTLTERSAPDKPEATPVSSAEQKEQASRRLKKWQNLPPFQRSTQAFAQRLALDGLTEDGLANLLGQSAEEIQASSTATPAWLEELLEAFGTPDAAVLACLPLEHIGDPASDAAFQALKPLLARGFARLLAGITKLQQRYMHLPFDPRSVGFLLLPHFLDRILNKPAKTLILELNVARVQNRLQGETPQERYLYFLQQLAQPATMLTLLEEYPVLGRQLVEMTGRWVERGLELLQRLCADWDGIRETFCPVGDPGALSEIREGAGDAHQGERSVTLLTWTSGLRLVYKPRSLAIDAHFQEMLNWLNAHGCQPAFRALKLLNKERYGWYEFATASGCANQGEVERFYQRTGGYLALLYFLEATDFHAENLLAAGEHPLLVDLESLFQPYTERYEGADRYGYELLTHSVRRVGLLPQRRWLNETTRGTDLSGLGGPTHQQAEATANAWEGLGTDEMRVRREQVEIKLGAHRPTLQGTEVETRAYEQHIVAGFTNVYHILLQQREELLQTILPRFAHDEVRILLRQTQQYARLISDGSHPDVLRDALDRDWLFDRLWIGVEQQPYLARVIAAERADIQDGDIPKFTTSPDSRDLRTARGECIANFFPLSGLDLVKEGLQRMSERDLERQVWIIRASFACMEMNNTEVKPVRSLQLHPANAAASRADLIAQARAIGERLYNLAVIEEETVGWLVATLAGGQEWTPAPAGPDLYNGLPGIALFLAYLGELSGEERYTHLARLAAQTLQKFFVPGAQIWQWGIIGAFDGVSSLIYLFAHLGTLWQDPTLYQEAREIVPFISKLLETEKPFDVLSGSAGAIAALLSLYAVAP